MTIEEKGEAFRALFLIRDFGQFLANKRNHGEDMQATSCYAMLLNSLSDDDIEALQENNVRFGMIYAPGSHIVLPPEEVAINLLCFEKHLLDKFNKQQVVALILHEIGHVFNPNLEGDEHEFAADNYARERGYGESIATGLSFGIENNFEGFNQAINERRIERLIN